MPAEALATPAAASVTGRDSISAISGLRHRGAGDPNFGRRPARTFFNHQMDAQIAIVEQGQFVVGEGPELVLSTVLGSRVSACVYDPVAKIGGMNHFLLAEEGSNSSNNPLDPGMALRYGSYAMELLVNEILGNGGMANRLHVKLFGGGNVVAALSDVGGRNVKFALEYVKTEGYTLASTDLGGNAARRVQFWPGSGRARISYLSSEHKAVPAQHGDRRVSNDAPAAGRVEMFQ
jgi:chemotaxis protein CheD